MIKPEVITVYNCLLCFNFWTDDLPFEFRALELALELTCTSLDAQVLIHHKLYYFRKSSTIFPLNRDIQILLFPLTTIFTLKSAAMGIYAFAFWLNYVAY
jgi:hypothetical protein